MTKLRKRVAGTLIGIVGMATVGGASVALAAVAIRPLDLVGLGPRRGGQGLGLHTQMTVGVSRDPAGTAAHQGERSVRVAATQVRVAGAELRQPLEELGVRRSLRLLPAGL